MKCEKCDVECILNEWEGWIVQCPVCFTLYRAAKEEEIKKWEKWMEEYLDKKL